MSEEPKYRPGMQHIVTLPMPVKSLETREGTVYAVLEGGATFDVGALVARPDKATTQ